MRSSVVALLALASVFSVPWFAPSFVLELGPRGEATNVGFSVLVSCVLFGLAVLVLANLKSSVPGVPLLRAPVRWFPPLAESPLEVSTFVVALVVVGLVTVLFPVSLRMPYFGDQAYFLARIDLVALGQRPWLDFEFHHGPLLLYGPWLVARTGLVGFERAYLLATLLATLLGLAGLFALTRSLPLVARSRALVFAGLASFWCVPFVALSRTPLVVLWGPVSVLLVVHLARRRVRTSRRLLATAAMVVVGFGLGEEAGFGALLGCVVAARVRRGTTFVLSWTAGMVFSFLAFQTLFGRAGLPLYPNAANLLLVGGVFATIPRMLRGGFNGSSDEALDAGLGASALVAAVAALSRGEVFDGVLAAVVPLLGLAALASRQFLSNVLLGVASLVAQLGFWVPRGASYGDALVASFFFREDSAMLDAHQQGWDGLRRSSPKAAHLRWDELVPYPVEGHLVPAGSDWCLPLGGMTDGGADRRVKLRGGSTLPYYPIPTDGLEAADVERVAENALRCELVVLPARLLESLDRAPGDERAAARHRRWLSDRLLFPAFGLRETPPPPSPRQLVARAILHRSTVVGARILPHEGASALVVLAPVPAPRP